MREQDGFPLTHMLSVVRCKLEQILTPKLRLCQSWSCKLASLG